MILGAAGGLLGLLAVPAILLIHLYRRRYRTLPATAVFLYGPPDVMPATGRTRQSLRSRASLWLELAAALAATWWLVDPHLSQREAARHLVLVLDTRRSLQATHGGVTVAARLATEASTLVRSLDRGDRVTLVLSGLRPRLLVGPAAAPAAALAGLAHWQAESPWHELGGSIALAQELGGAGAQVVVLSDRVPSECPPGVGWCARGVPEPTIGFADARWIDDGQGSRVLARLDACGGGPRACVIGLRDATGLVVARQSLIVAPGRPALVTLSAPAGTSRLTLAVMSTTAVPTTPPDSATAGPASTSSASVSPSSSPGSAAATAAAASPAGGGTTVLDRPDAYPYDETVTLLPPPPRSLRVAIALPALPALPRAAVERALAAVGGVQVVAGDQPADLHIDAGAPAPPPGCWQLSISPGAAAPVLGPYLARRGHPLLADVDFTAVTWCGGGVASSDDDVLLAAGDAVLITERRIARDRQFTLHLDLTRHGLSDHPAWPALIANLIATRRAELPGPARSNLPCGEPLNVTLPAGAVALQVTAADGEVARFPADQRGAVLLPGFEQRGEYRLDAVSRSGAPVNVQSASTPSAQAGSRWAQVMALGLDPRLADLTSCASSDHAAASAGGARVERSRSLGSHLLPLVAVALGAILAWLHFPREEGLR